jgi:hypothetical protein
MAFTKLADEKKKLLDEDDASDEASLQLQVVTIYLRQPRKLTKGRRWPLDLDLSNKAHMDIYMYGVKEKIETLRDNTPTSLHSIIDEHDKRISKMIKTTYIPQI